MLLHNMSCTALIRSDESHLSLTLRTVPLLSFSVMHKKHSLQDHFSNSVLTISGAWAIEHFLKSPSQNKPQTSQSLHVTQAFRALTLHHPLLMSIGIETQIWMMAGFFPLCISRYEILYWEEEILKWLCLFFFIVFGVSWVEVFFPISVSAIAQKFVVTEYVWWRWIVEKKQGVQIPWKVYKLSCAFYHVDKTVFAVCTEDPYQVVLKWFQVSSPKLA